MRLAQNPDVRRLCNVAAALLVVSSAAASGSPRSASEQSKIEWLLSGIRTSKATFIRNGKGYKAEKAASHLKRKLSFAGGRVRTAREFIRGIATRSEESGEPYTIRFKHGQTQLLGEWLQERLEAFERSRGGTTGPREEKLELSARGERGHVVPSSGRNAAGLRSEERRSR